MDENFSEPVSKVSLVDAMKGLDEMDFRVKGRSKHVASEMAVITLCAFISGGTSYYDIVNFATERLDWLREFLELKNGIPSHDAFRYFWKHLPPAVFNACFMKWVDSFLELEDGDGIHIDGKCIRRAIAASGKIPCIVSAYSSRERIVIGQVKTVRASRLVFQQPAASIQQPVSVRSDPTPSSLAAGCWLLNTQALRRASDARADYLLALKDNQKLLVESIAELFETKFRNRETRFKEYEETDKGHGRVTTRKCCQTDYIEWMTEKDRKGWIDLKSVCRIETETTKTSTRKTTTDVRYFISSLGVDPAKALRTAVEHWDIENPLHWTLDMVMDEDHSRARAGYAAENLAIVRHIAFDLLRLDGGTSGGIKRKKQTMTWNSDKLKQALLAA